MSFDVYKFYDDPDKRQDRKQNEIQEMKNHFKV